MEKTEELQTSSYYDQNANNFRCLYISTRPFSIV